MLPAQYFSSQDEGIKIFGIVMQGIR